MSSLLHYTVHQYIKKFERNDAGTEKVSLPLPDPSDMSQAMGVNFDELGKELVRIQKDFEGMIIESFGNCHFVFHHFKNHFKRDLLSKV